MMITALCKSFNMRPVGGGHPSAEHRVSVPKGHPQGMAPLSRSSMQTRRLLKSRCYSSVLPTCTITMDRQATSRRSLTGPSFSESPLRGCLYLLCGRRNTT